MLCGDVHSLLANVSHHAFVLIHMESILQENSTVEKAEARNSKVQVGSAGFSLRLMPGGLACLAASLTSLSLRGNLLTSLPASLGVFSVSRFLFCLLNALSCSFTIGRRLVDPC